MAKNTEDSSESAVFLVLRHKTTTIYLDAKESDTIESVKEQVQGLLGFSIPQQKLFKADSKEELTDSKSLGNCGITGATALAYRPFELHFTPEVKGQWEEIEVTPYSQPPELPDVMKPEPTDSTN